MDETISIHTSAKEVTSYKKQKGGILDYFNPHFREGSDKGITFHTLIIMHFNPHFREGSDPPFQSVQYRYLISIHTSAKEVTD